MHHRELCELQVAQYKHLDVPLKKILSEHKVSCSKGCNHCCNQLTTIMLPEGVLMADRVLSWSNWQKWARKFHKWCVKFTGPDTTRDTYFESNTPCPFVNGRDGLCRVYDIRPAACRFLYAVSPRHMCSTSNTSKMILYVNLHDLEAEVWRLANDVQAEGTHAPSAPLPLMVLACMRLIQPANRLLIELTDGIPTPYEWMQQVVDTKQFWDEGAPQERNAVLAAAKKAGLIPESAQ